MKRILKTYCILTTICFCATLFLVGIITAENNSRKLSFGEEYESIQIYNTSSEKIGVGTEKNSIEITKEMRVKCKEVLEKCEPLLSPVFSNFGWVIENIKEITN